MRNVSLQLGIHYENTQNLSEYYLTDGFVLSDWSAEYDLVEVSNRTISDVFVTIDFNLREGALGYYGRQVSWQEDEHLFNLRFVVPNNNPDLLANLQIVFLEKLVFYPHLVDSQLSDWRSEMDAVNNFMIKLPNDWEILNGGTGDLATYNSPLNEGLLITTQNISKNCCQYY